MKRIALLLMTTAALFALAYQAANPNTAQAQRTHECYWCHTLHGSGAGGIPLTTFSADVDLCMSCHDDAGPVDTGPPDFVPIPKEVAIHAGPKHQQTPTVDETTCWDCHRHWGATGGTNLSNIPQQLESKYPLGTGSTKTIVFTARSGPNSFAEDVPPYDGPCEVCHTQTKFHRNDGTGPGGVHNSQATCTTCHTHDMGFQPPRCVECHDVPRPIASPTRRAITPEFDLDGHHINFSASGYASSADIQDADCEVCHDQNAGPHRSGQVWLNDVDNPANGPYNPNVAADVVAFCTTCHDADGANGSAPFVDGMAPPVIDGTAWLATGHGTQLTGRACLECHISGHGKARSDMGRGSDIDNEPNNNVCLTCHGVSDPPAAYINLAKWTPTHRDPNNATLQWEMACTDCHTPHFNQTNRYNYPPYVANVGDTHPHNHTSDAGGNIAGINIKLMGRNEDGSGRAKVATPLQVLSEGAAGPCVNSDIELQIAVPPFSFGQGPATTIMVGDRMFLNNAGADFPNTTTFRVKETVWDNLGGAPPTGWVCFDHPTNPAATTTGFAYVHSAGWYPKPLVGNATWAGGTATLTFSGPTSLRYGMHSIQVGDQINVIGVSPAGFNGRYAVTAVTDATVSYALVSDPGAYVSGGEVEYVGSVKGITNITVAGPPPNPDINITDATWAAGKGPNPDRATITTEIPHGYSSNDTVVVSGVVPSGYNGTFTVSSATSTAITYDLTPDPGTYVPGTGTVPDNNPPAGPTTMTVTLNTNSNDGTLLDISPTTGAPRDGDIVTLAGVNPVDYDGRYEVESVDAVSNPPTVTLRCAPFLDTAVSGPPCFTTSLPAYVGGGILQSSGSMRAVVFESRGTDNNFTADFLSDWTHSFTNTDNDEDGWMDGPCETCHTLTSNHKNDDYNNTHNNGRTCTDGCHSHMVNFDKSNDPPCPRPSGICPPNN